MRLEREVAELQKELAGTPAPPAAAASDARVPHSDADNPAYVQIQAQLSATLNDLNALESETAKLRAKADEYQRNITLAPQIEQQYRELNRDYENTKLKYQELRSKQSEATTAQNLEADRKGERFTLIEPPLPPEEPASPNRRMIFAAGCVLSSGRQDLFRLTGIPPLALVPHIDTEAERRAGRRAVRLAVGTAMATAGVAITLVHFLYRPLDVLWFSFSRRIGL
jgi:hypothetical protein